MLKKGRIISKAFQFPGTKSQEALSGTCTTLTGPGFAGQKLKPTLFTANLQAQYSKAINRKREVIDSSPSEPPPAVSNLNTQNSLPEEQTL